MWDFSIHKNLHREFGLDGFGGIVVGGWWLMGFAFGQLDHYGIIVFNFFIGWEWWEKDDWEAIRNV